VDLRDEFIGRVVRGGSFAEVGGLWGTVNEKVSVALAHGARSAAMIDVTTPGTELWKLFEERLAALGLPPCQMVPADVCRLAEQPDRPVFDVVHCSGVLYHHPAPLTVLLALRKLTGSHLVLTSAVQQERVENRHGVYTMPPSGVLFVPALDERERLVLATYWEEEAGAACLGITDPVTWDANDFGPWWWLPTPRALAGMCESCGFRVVQQGPTWNGNASTLLLEAR
jgi:hypothetical protein